MKTALITGASRGIGRAAAELFAENGYAVVLNYLHSEQAALKLQNALRKRNATALAVKADVSDSAQVNAMFALAREQLGGVDVLVNNAGIAGQKLLTDITDEEWARMIGVDLTGTFNCCRAALPHMIHRKSGKIVNLSSIWGIAGGSCEVPYSAAKAGVIGLTKALAKELGPSGIQVNCVAPGVIDTQMNAALGKDTLDALKDETPLMRLGTPEDIARSIYFLASPDADFITGQVLSPNGGFVI